ncbi:MAG: S-layer homology domain-containing protein [Clostridia bacterium]|nr:S-layer homology domain-containing protein [Clostridia bacterium]
MIKKKILSGILCATFLFSTVSAAKLTFSDVENDPTVSWARTYINEMAEMGYIKGYEDGTFQPNKPISKTEALILLSRMIGLNDSNYADSLEYALDEFDVVLKKYTTNYKQEVAFLLYTGVLHPSDLDDYLTNANKNEPLKRYEAAILLTKLLGAVEEVESNMFVTSSYADTLDIPELARPYVEYVKDQGIMQGMGNNADGNPEFSPNTPVTRSQMSKMLYMLIDVLDVTTASGVIVETNAFDETVTIAIDGENVAYPVDKSTEYKINGEAVEFEDLSEGMTVKISLIAGKLALIENYVVLEDTVIYGLVSGTKPTQESKSITIADANDKSIVDTYVLSEDAKIRIDGAIDLFTKVKKNDYVELKIEDGLVTELSVIGKNSTVTGTLESVDATGEYTTLNIETQSGETEAYEISADGVVVSRNSLDSNLAALMEGDKIVLKLTYGKITKISASSKNQTLAGKMSSITHTTTGSSLTIEADGKKSEFKINKSAKVVINSTEEATVYDLRPGTDINITIESSEITQIKAAATIEKSSLTGTIKTINLNYGLLIIEEDGVEYNVFCKSSTNIIDSKTGKTVSLKSVETGRSAIITGSNASGVLEATAIVLQ